MFCFEEFKHSSSCIPKCNSLYLIFWDGVMSFLTISFVFHDSQVFKSDIFKSIIFSSFKWSFQPINLFVGVILGYISPTAFPKECSYLWCLSMIQSSPSHLGEEVFHLFVVHNQSLFSLVAEFHLKFWDVFHKPTTSLFISLLVFQLLCSYLHGRVFSKRICGRSWHFHLHSFIPMFYLLSFLPKALWYCSLRPIFLFCSSRFSRT